MLDDNGGGVWQLLDDSGVTIPMGASHEFLVRFSPKTAGRTSTRLLITHDDDGRPPISIDLVGTGIDRDVRFTPDMIRLGYTPVGVPVTIEDALSIANADPTHVFSINRIEIEDGSRLTIENLEPNAELPPLSQRTLAVTFMPDREGVFTTTVRLFLDMNPIAQHEGRLEGTAFSVGVHGGGGCHTGQEPAGGTVLLAFAILLAPRRRRIAPMFAMLALLSVHGAAAADDIQIGTFHPVPATSGSGFQLESAEVGRDGAWVASGAYSLATNSMVIETSVEGQDIAEARPLAQRSMITLGGAYAFLGRFEAGLRMPFYAQRSGPGAGDPRIDLPSVDGVALGDLALHTKTRIWRSSRLTAGTSLHVTLPTSTTDRFTGLDLPSVRVLGLATISPAPRLTLSFNGGPVLRKTAVYRKEILIEQGSGLSWAAGGSLRLADGLFVTGEVFGELVPRSPQMAGSMSPIEGLVGASYRVQRTITLGIAAGRGISSGLGAPDLRGTVLLSFAPGAAVLSPFALAKPLAPDADDDGIPDKKDQCANEAEDRNGIKDTDGCPDGDADRDAIVDARDRCPRQAEDRDGYQEGDGCPELDNDRDGLADAQDRCPLQPETINGNKDDDGCPDAGGETETHLAVDPDQSPAKAAEATFLHGRELMKEKKYFAACTAFEQSQRLDPQTGTQYNLALCYAETGKLATALTIHRELVRTDRNAERREKSNEHASQLAQRVPRLKMTLVGMPADVKVFMNGTNVNALIGIETPVDFGTYTIVAGAPGHRGWRQTVEIKKDGELVTVLIDLGSPTTP